MILSLHHVDIIIDRGAEEKAREFYCQLLGLKEIPKPEELQKNGGLWLELGKQQVHLSFEKKEGVDPRKTKSHVAYQVESLAEIEEKLVSFGLPVKRQTQFTGYDRIESEDPFGNRMEFLAKS